MVLWFASMQAVRSLRPACRRSRTFRWMVLALAGLCCRSDRAGVTSYMRVLGFGPEAYHRFLHLFHSKGLDLDGLTDCWVRLCLVLFQPTLAGSRLVCRVRQEVGGHAALGLNLGYHRLKCPSSSSLRTLVRAWSRRCAPRRVHCICCFLTNRLLTTWLIVDSTNAVLILSPCRHRSPKFGMKSQLFLM